MGALTVDGVFISRGLKLGIRATVLCHRRWYHMMLNGGYMYGMH
jgi:hypothetical protein